MSDQALNVNNSATSTQTPGSPSANPGQFRKGQSGNPGGRPRGARNKATLAIAALLDEAGPRLLQEGIDRALDGDSLLLRCCIVRLAPAPRGRPVELDLAEGSAAGDVLASMTATVRAMAEGALSPLEANDVAQVIEGQRRAIETEDLERRLTRLEAAADQVAERIKRGDAHAGAKLPDAVLDAPLDEPYEPPEDTTPWHML
jgi:hypothetical protein